MLRRQERRVERGEQKRLRVVIPALARPYLNAPPSGKLRLDVLRRPRPVILALALFCLPSPTASAFTFLFSGTNANTVTHPMGYTGMGESLSISVGINPFSPHRDAMVIPTQNALATWNQLVPTLGNLHTGNVPPNAYDFESVLLHEIGHVLGLDHPNLGSLPGQVSGANEDHTAAQVGSNGRFDLHPGPDETIGSRDDQRGDDVNRNFFRTANNNPFTIGRTVDRTTYSRNLADLPGSDSYSANGNRDVAALLADVPDNTEAVMQQRAFLGEVQRTLGHDDVAGIRYAMSGADELEGTADDYTFTLTFAGMDLDADVVIAFDAAQTGFALTTLVATPRGIGGSQNHLAVASANMYFHPTSVTWFFNDQPAVVPEPGSWALLALGLGAAAIAQRRRRTQAATQA